MSRGEVAVLRREGMASQVSLGEPGIKVNV